MKNKFKKLQETLVQQLQGMTKAESELFMESLFEIISRFDEFEKMTHEQMKAEIKKIKIHRAELPKNIGVVGLNDGSIILNSSL